MWGVWGRQRPHTLGIVPLIRHRSTHIIGDAGLRQSIAEGSLGTRFRSSMRGAAEVFRIRIGDIGLCRRHRRNLGRLHALGLFTLRILLLRLLILKSRDTVMSLHAIQILNDNRQNNNCHHENNKHCADAHRFRVCHTFLTRSEVLLWGPKAPTPPSSGDVGIVTVEMWV